MRQARAEALVDRANWSWYQRFPLVDGVTTPGHRDVLALLESVAFPKRLDGKTVLDIGTSNGGVAFEAERRGAARVVASDLTPPRVTGFAQVRDFLGSNVEYVQSTVYELADVLAGETFDVVCFFGVLYHLRHPLLGLDKVREVARETVYLETAVADGLENGQPETPNVLFFRGSELAGDATNWFAPTVRVLLEWCESAGLEPRTVWTSSPRSPHRAAVTAHVVDGAPEYLRVSYERRLHVRTDLPAGFDIAIDVESRLVCAPGETVPVRCTITNRTGRTLASDGPHPIRLSHRIDDAVGITIAAGARTSLSEPLAPDETVEVEHPLEAPADPGRYVVRVSLVEELLAWFDDVDPANAATIDLTVEVPARSP